MSLSGTLAKDPPAAGPRSLKVSIIIPVYNEYVHLEDVIRRVREAPLPEGCQKEIIVIDDGSTDGTSDLLRRHNSDGIKVHHSMLNFGKGTAIRVGLKQATGDIIVIQDGDQEYDPNEIQTVVGPIASGRARVVYGSRFLGRIRGMRIQYRLCNQILIWSVRLLYSAWITDEATAYKAFAREVLLDIPLTCRRFEFCPEVTAKLLRRGYTIHEVPISYYGRTVDEGKKIRFMDAIEAFWTLLKYRFVR